MAEPVKPRRPYHSPLRREQAAETRRQILRAAQERFERDGYAATSMSAIASAAGVSLKTVYLVFETRAACCEPSGTCSCAATTTALRSASSAGIRRSWMNRIRSDRSA